MSSSIIKISKQKLRLIASLKQKKIRKETGLFVAEGSKCVNDTLGSFNLEMLVASNYWLENHLNTDVYTKQDYNDYIFSASPEELKRMSSLSTPPEVIAVFRQQTIDFDTWQNGINDRITLLLDGIQDPGNLGTIIRTADWFGVHYIAASHTTVDLFNAKTVQATMGATSRVKMIYSDLDNIIDSHNNLPVYGTLLDGQDIYSTEIENKGFIIFGSEGHGISESLRRRVTQSLLIPSYPPGESTSESLNVAVATAVTLAEFRRRLT